MPVNSTCKEKRSVPPVCSLHAWYRSRRYLTCDQRPDLTSVFVREWELLHGCSPRVSCQQELQDLICSRFLPQEETDLFVVCVCVCDVVSLQVPEINLQPQLQKKTHHDSLWEHEKINCEKNHSKLLRTTKTWPNYFSRYSNLNKIVLFSSSLSFKRYVFVLLVTLLALGVQWKSGNTS